jgi:hypothetical protein
MRPTRLLLVAGLGLVGLFPRPAAAADWAVAPAANQFGAGREHLRYTIDPGAAVQDGLVVRNAGAAPLRLALRPAASGWVRLARDAVTVAPGRSAEVPFSVAPPRDAEPGDYEGAIVATAGGGRLDVPIRLRVGGALKPGLAVEDVQLDGSSVRFTVRNTGNAILTARPRVKVSGPFGRFAVESDALRPSPELLPGETWKGRTSVKDVTPAVRLTATVTVLGLLTDAAGSSSPLAAVQGSGHGWSVPWLPVIAVLAVVALVAAGVRLWA